MKFWKSNFFYVRSQNPWGYNPTVLTDTPPTDPPAPGYDESMNRLKERVKNGHYHIERMIHSQDLLSQAGILPFPVEGETNWGYMPESI